MTDIITLDFESHYGDGTPGINDGKPYSLSSMTTEEYVRDPRFETILCGFKINDQKPWFVVGHDEVARQLADLDIPKRTVLAHHAHFDGLILSHHYGLAPKMWLDTLGMARAVHGANGGLSLAKLAVRYGIGQKGEEVVNARNMHLQDFMTAPIPPGLTHEQTLAHLELHASRQLLRYGEYCGNDCDLEYKLFLQLLPHFSKSELMINDQVIRMFTEPCFQLDAVMLDAYREKINAEKMLLLMQAGVQQADLMSNDKFAECLRELGVEPPLKVSPTWLKKTDAERLAAQAKDPDANGVTYAFAKTDPAMQQLQEHPDERVQILVEARLKNKTTIAEKGAIRLIEMNKRGRATVYLKYSGASGTHRLCLTGDTRITVLRAGKVLEIPLSTLDSRDLVWDSEAFVAHGGLIDQGEHEVMTYQGVTGTPDHRVYCDEIEEAIELREASQRGYTLTVAACPARQPAAACGANCSCSEPGVPRDAGVPVRVDGPAASGGCNCEAAARMPDVFQAQGAESNSGNPRWSGATAPCFCQGSQGSAETGSLDPPAPAVSGGQGQMHKPT